MEYDHMFNALWFSIKNLPVEVEYGLCLVLEALQSCHDGLRFVIIPLN